MRRGPLLLLFGALAACGDDGGGPADAGGGRDARPPADAHILDASPTEDGGSADAGSGLDGGSIMCGSGGCDPRRPSDCPGGRCVLAGATTECRPLGGTGGEESDPCMSADECGRGLGCFLEGDGSTCRQVCCPGMGDACDVGLGCVRIARLFDGTLSSWGRCAPPRPCDVLEPELDCEDGEGCYIVSELGATDCMPEGTYGPGDRCESQEDCMSGLFCGGFDGVVERTCIRICRLDGTVPCPVDEGMCRAYAHSPEGTGLCTLPRP